MKRVRMLTLTAIATVVLIATVHFGRTAAHAAPQPTRDPAHEPMPPVTATPGDNNDHIKLLDQQIKALRTEFHAALDPLEAQVKATKEKYEPQIESLVDQRKTLVEQGKPPNIQDLDRDEATELASLADREKSELDQVRQKYAGEKKDIEKKFDDRRKAAHAGK